MEEDKVWDVEIHKIPDLLPPKKNTVERVLMKYGSMRKHFLEVEREEEYSKMASDGSLIEHCFLIQEQADQMFTDLSDKLMEQNGVTEELKHEDWLEWLQRTNNVYSQADEIVQHDIVFS